MSQQSMVVRRVCDSQSFCGLTFNTDDLDAPALAVFLMRVAVHHPVLHRLPAECDATLMSRHHSG